MQKRKISYEQDKALASGRNVARANQRRRVAANQAADKAKAEREREQAAQAERERQQRAGFELGDRVTGRERTFGRTVSGRVIAGPPSERNEGVWILADSGHEMVLSRYSVKAES